MTSYYRKGYKIYLNFNLIFVGRNILNLNSYTNSMRSYRQLMIEIGNPDIYN